MPKIRRHALGRGLHNKGVYSWQTIWKRTVKVDNRASKAASSASRAGSPDSADRASRAGRAGSRAARVDNSPKRRAATRVRTKKTSVTVSAALRKFVGKPF